MGIERKYWVEPSILQRVSETLKSEISIGGSFADACKNTTGIVTEDLEVFGLGNIPDSSTLVLIKNHHCHFDFVFLHEIFNIRPDIHIPIKASNETNNIMSQNLLLLRKVGAHADREDVTRMQNFSRTLRN